MWMIRLLLLVTCFWHTIQGFDNFEDCALFRELNWWLSVEVSFQFRIGLNIRLYAWVISCKYKSNGNIKASARIIFWLTLCMVGDCERTSSFSRPLNAWTTRHNFSIAFSVPGFLILSTNLNLNILVTGGISVRLIFLKAFFFSRSLIISFWREAKLLLAEGLLGRYKERLSLGFFRNWAGKRQVLAGFVLSPLTLCDYCLSLCVVLILVLEVWWLSNTWWAGMSLLLIDRKV